MLTTEIEANVPQRLVIPFGQIMGLVGGESTVAKYIAFVQDDDVGDKRGGEKVLCFL